jgi:uncharacterized protein (TIGR02266 family)
MGDSAIDMTSNASDKRVSKRVPSKFRVDYKSEGHFLIEHATNISEHGIFVETDKPLKKGSEIELEFSLPETRKKMKVMGVVMWVNRTRKNADQNYNPGMGIRFINLNDIDRETLMAAIKRIAVL